MVLPTNWPDQDPVPETREAQVEVQICDSCGRSYNYIWWAPHAIWNGLVDRSGAGQRCIDCFDRLLRGTDMFGRWTFELVRQGDLLPELNASEPPPIDIRFCSQAVAGIEHDRHYWHAGASQDPDYYWCRGWHVG